MSSPTRRVVITGLGQISPLGNTPQKLWDGLVSGTSGVTPLTAIPSNRLPIAFAGEAGDFTGHIDDFGDLDKATKRSVKKGQRLMCREIEMGVAAAQLALQHAGLPPGSYDVDRSGVVFGSDYIMTMPQEFEEAIGQCREEDGSFGFRHWAEKGRPKVAPLWLLKYLPNMPASHIAIYNDLRGPSNSITFREASSNLALSEAWFTIRRGAADLIVAGATGTRLHPVRTAHMLLQEEVATTSARDDPAVVSRPFAVDRRGMVLGEGAGAVILEELSRAQVRGATIYGELVGYGSSTVCDPAGVADIRQAISNSLRQCFRSSGLSPDQIGHIHAHGISTTSGDAAEAAAIGEVLAEGSTPRIPIAAAKSNFGNLGAASGLVEVVASLLAMRHGTLFPVLNSAALDPRFGLELATAEHGAGDSFINLNVTPQGQASAIVIRRFAA